VLGNFLILILTLGNWKWNRNFSFLGPINGVLNFWAQVGLSSLNVTFYYFLGMFYLETLENPDLNFIWQDFVHVSFVIVIRIFVISTKYGFYSKEHMKVMANVVIDADVQLFDLLISV
jgi:hypothetical protein